MYTRCIHCNGPLGANEVIESFPVGRRLAFDPAKGRLWVVCRKCARWNLTPLEERWEAFEECERHFRATPTRLSTDNIGLARLAEGLELVRIGEPLRPEFAAWRYGDQFGKRSRRNTGVAAALMGGTLLLQTGVAAVAPALMAFALGMQVVTEIPVKGRIRMGDRILSLHNRHGIAARIGQSPDDGGIAVRLRYKGKVEYISGPAGEQAARVLLAINNGMLGARSMVRNAVTELESAGTPERYLRSFAPHTRLPVWKRRTNEFMTTRVANIAPRTRLALEMALHEEQERRALEADLAELEQEWRAAEEIAAIADNLLTPDSHRDFIERNR